MRRRILISAAAAALLLAYWHAAVTATCVNYEGYIHFQNAETLPSGSFPCAITRAGFQIAVCRGGYGIDLVDGTDAYEPAYLGHAPCRLVANEALIVSPYLFVADGDSGLTVVDITDPSSAFVCGGTTEPGYAECLTRTRDQIIVGTDEFLWFVDYSAPCSPSVEDGVETINFVMDVTTGLEDQYAFAAVYDSGVQIVDIAGQYTTSTIPTTGEVNCLSVVDHYLYAGLHVSSNKDSLLVYDIIDPANPARVTSLKLNRPPLEVQYAYQRLWVANDRGIDVVSVAGGYQSPVLVDFLATYGSTVGCIPTTNELLVASWETSPRSWTGVEFFGLGNREMVEAEDLIVIDTPIEMVASGSYGYVTTIDGDLMVVDLLTNGAISSEYTTDWSTGVAMWDQETAYVCSDGGSLFAVDLSDPSDPDVVAAGDGHGYAWSVDCSETRAYTATGSPLFCIFDITPGDTLPMVCENEAPGAVDALRVRGDYLYGVGMGETAGEAGLHVFDITDPDTAVIVGSWSDTMSNRLYAVEVVGDLAYLAGQEVFYVLDISDPSDPAMLGRARVPGRHQGVSAGDGYAYVGGYSGGYLVIDVTDVSDPRPIGQFCGPGIYAGTRSAFVYGEYVYVADENEGVHVFGRACGDMTGVPESEELLKASRLACAPNPFGDQSVLSFTMPAGGSARLSVYDVAGRLVRTLVDGACPAGPRAVEWDGRDASGKRVAAGVYFAKLNALDETALAKVVLLK